MSIITGIGTQVRFVILMILYSIILSGCGLFIDSGEGADSDQSDAAVTEEGSQIDGAAADESGQSLSENAGLNSGASENADQDGQNQTSTDETSTSTEQNEGGPVTTEPKSEPAKTDQDQDGIALEEGDCDDTDATIHPNATETCDGVDNNCDGQIDEGLLNTYYADVDGDEFGDDSDTVSACSQPEAYIETGGDCNDRDGFTNPGAAEVCDSIDNDCDGVIDEGIATTTYYADSDQDSYGDPTVTSDACEQPENYVADSSDCNDESAISYPGATEVCDEIDNDCDSDIDEGVTTTYFIDSDSDAFGVATTTVEGCSVPSGYSELSSDCNDSNAAINPSAVEVCDEIDNDCDGSTDEFVQNYFFPDVDGDGFGDGAAVSILACNAPTEYVSDDSDCDDNDSITYPGATEICDEIDNDCDSTIDEGVTTTYYIDADSDGYGTTSTTAEACSVPSGYSAVDGDCDDSDVQANPGLAESDYTCDGKDNDCNSIIDDTVTSRFYADLDADTYGATSSYVDACSAPSNYVSDGSDCDDTSSSINPAASEVCDSIDNNCDGQIDEGVTTTYYVDSDEDEYGSTTTGEACPDQSGNPPTGYSSVNTDCDDNESDANPGATEVCDLIDNNCDSEIDESFATTTYYADADEDGFGDPDVSWDACMQPDGYTDDDNDCNDADSGPLEVDSTGTLGDYTDLQSAIDAASDGDCILVYAGTYTNTDSSGNAATTTVVNKLIDIWSYEGADQTFIEGGQSVRAMSWNNYGKSSGGSLKGFTLQNSYNDKFTSYGTGFGGQNLTDFQISECTFADNLSGDAYTRGGGAAVRDSSGVIVSGNTFTGNSAVYGAGLFLSGDSHIINENTFDQNIGHDFIHSSNGQQYSYGGAVYITDAEDIEFTNNIFTDNEAGGGGAVHVESYSVTFSGNQFTGNEAVESGGGAINKNSGTLTISGNIFSDNISARSGGAIQLKKDNSTSNPDIFNNNQFLRNNANDYYTSSSSWNVSYGHAIAVNSTKGIQVLNNVFVANGYDSNGADSTSKRKGVISLLSAKSTDSVVAYILNNVFLSNNGHGFGSVYRSSSFNGDVYSVNNIIKDPVDCGLQLNYDTTGTYTTYADYNLFNGIDTSTVTNAEEAYFCGDSNYASFSVGNIIETDPTFSLSYTVDDISPVNGIPDELESSSATFDSTDFALDSASDAIDAGTTDFDLDGSPDDIDGDGIIEDWDGDGSADTAVSTPDLGILDGLYGDWSE